MCREDKMDSPIHTNYIQSGGATTLIIIVDGADAVGSFVTCSTVPWNTAVPPDGKKIARILADVSVTFHVEQERSVVDSAGIFTLHGDDGPVPLRGEGLHLVAASNFQEIRKYLGPYSLYP